MRTPDFDRLEAEDDTRLDFPKLIHKFKINGIYFLICIVLFASVAYLYLYVANPPYNTVATVQIKDSDRPNASPNGGAILTLHDLRLIPNMSNVYKQQKLENDDLKFIFYLYVNNAFKVLSNEKQWFGHCGKPLILSFAQLTLTDNQLTKPWDWTEAVILSVSNIVIVADICQKSIQTDISEKQSSMISSSQPTLILQQCIDILNSLLNVYQIADVVDIECITYSTLQFINNQLVVVRHKFNSSEAGIQTFKQDNNLAGLSGESQGLISQTMVYECKHSAGVGVVI